MFTLGLALISWKSGISFSWLYLGTLYLDAAVIDLIGKRPKRGVEININGKDTENG